MRILIDIGHPAHVHYFRNFLKIMESKGHKILVTARDKEVTHNLLNAYGIPFISRGKGGQGLIGKIKYLPLGNLKIFKASKEFKPDIYLSFASPYAAQVSRIFRKPHITFDDTEHAKIGHLLYMPFSTTILTPDSFLTNIGEKQIRFNGFIELCYLHPKYFTPNFNNLSELDLIPQEKFSVVRFISWEASHDFGKPRLSLDYKFRLIKSLLKYGKVFISSEGELPVELEKYRLNLSPEKLHDLLAFASLYIGEGATTASECAVLGTPAIYVNSLDAGTLRKQTDYKLIFSYRDSTGVIEKADDLLQNPCLKNTWQSYREKMLSETINVTEFMVWFVSNYPTSVKIMKDSPEYQLNFK